MKDSSPSGPWKRRKNGQHNYPMGWKSADGDSAFCHTRRTDTFGEIHHPPGDAGSIWIALILLMLCFKKTRRVGVIAATALILSFVVNNLMLKNLVGNPPYRCSPEFSGWWKNPRTCPSPPVTRRLFLTAVVMFRELPRKYGVPALTLAFLIARVQTAGGRCTIRWMCSAELSAEPSLRCWYADSMNERMCFQNGKYWK